MNETWRADLIRDVEWANLKKEVKRQQGMIEGLERRRDELYSQNEAISRKIGDLENTVEILQNQNNRITDEKKDLEDFNKKLSEENHRLTEKYQKSIDEATRLNEERAALFEENRQLKTRLQNEKRKPLLIEAKVKT